jgi:hypothetical protein
LVLRSLIETFGDQISILTSFVLLERRPVLVKGYLESRTLREIRFLAPHRDLYEFGRNIPRASDEAKQFIGNVLEAEGLSSTDPAPRCSLILAPNVDRQFAETLLGFDRGWVASCVLTPKQEEIQKSNVAIYEANEKRWLNIDPSEVKTEWIKSVIDQAMAKKDDELAHAYLDLVITQEAKKASTLHKYLCNGLKEDKEIWRDLGEPDNDEEEIIASLCRSEHNIDTHFVFSNTAREAVEKQSRQVLPAEIHAPRNRNTVKKLIQRITEEEERLKKSIEVAKALFLT